MTVTDMKEAWMNNQIRLALAIILLATSGTLLFLGLVQWAELHETWMFRRDATHDEMVLSVVSWLAVMPFMAGGLLLRNTVRSIVS